MTKSGPTLQRYKLARELTRLRIESGHTIAEVATRLGKVRSAASHLETGRTVPDAANLEIMARMYGVTDEQLAEMDQWRADANRRGWWSEYRLEPWLRTYLGLETDASSMRRYTMELVPGMLQTKEYAEVTLASERERLIAARLHRAQRLTDDTFSLSVVFSEGLLWRTSYMGAVGLGQLRHLRGTMDLPTVTMQVLPFGRGWHPSMGASFTVLNFPVGTLGAVVYQEFNSREGVIDDVEAVRGAEQGFTALATLALNPRESAEVIEEFIVGAKEILHVSRS